MHSWARTESIVSLAICTATNFKAPDKQKILIQFWYTMSAKITIDCAKCLCVVIERVLVNRVCRDEPGRTMLILRVIQIRMSGQSTHSFCTRNIKRKLKNFFQNCYAKIPLLWRECGEEGTEWLCAWFVQGCETTSTLCFKIVLWSRIIQEGDGGSLIFVQLLYKPGWRVPLLLCRH